ncbi:MAG: sugar phosphate isomerase/epimerase [Verrucomicrobia bacterium]|nr:sugar phosphate isomerase/epimerase [Verrucomicrobiota bacterium]
MSTPTVCRRSFLKYVAATLAGGGIASTARAVEPFNRPGKPVLRLSLAAYSFRDFFNAAEPAKRLTLPQFIDFCAEHGCEGTELTSYYFPKPLDSAFLIRLKRHAFLRGLTISGTAVGNNFARPPGPELDREIAAVKEWIDHAAVLGAPHIRVFAGEARGLDKAEAKRQCIRALEECGEYAGRRGIWLGLENHGGIVAQVDDLLEILGAVKSPWVGVNFDGGNFYGPGDPYDDMARLAPYAVNAQIKVEVHHPGQGKKPADLPRIVRILRDANYQGFVALEYEANEDPRRAVPVWLNRLREAFAGA